ncbi:hypothetical protein VKT23_003107 [Stygiomarasmius scandens]|uniref:Uncharacterized protein n=1 Tax=Marasmiellus scandens TaxID=2682957 RepID=A0ABR1K0K6_9AGAR
MRFFLAWSWVVLCFPSARAVLVNRTIDDTLPDSTGASITYLPDGAWNDGTSCERCTAKPDSGQMSSGTWHDGTFYSKPGGNDFPNQVLNASTIFNGTSVYVFCALSRSKASPFGNSDMTFYIDGQLVGIFLKPASGTDGFDYDVPVYVNESLSPGFHKLVLQNGPFYSFDNGTETGSSATASPTSDPSSQSGSSSSNIGIIVGPVVAVSVVATLLGVCFLVRRRRLRNTARGLLPPPRPQSSQAITPYLLTQNPVPDSYPNVNGSIHNSTTFPTTFTSLHSESDLVCSTPSYGYGSRARYQNTSQLQPLPSVPPAYDLADAANAPTFALKH